MFNNWNYIRNFRQKQFSTIGAATFAIFIGILAGNTIFHKKVFDLGTKFAEKNLLNYSIVLMGANLNIMEIAALRIKWSSIYCYSNDFNNINCIFHR